MAYAVGRAQGVTRFRALLHPGIRLRANNTPGRRRAWQGTTATKLEGRGRAGQYLRFPAPGRHSNLRFKRVATFEAAGRARRVHPQEAPSLAAGARPAARPGGRRRTGYQGAGVGRRRGPRFEIDRARCCRLTGAIVPPRWRLIAPRPGRTNVSPSEGGRWSAPGSPPPDRGRPGRFRAQNIARLWPLGARNRHTGL